MSVRLPQRHARRNREEWQKLIDQFEQSGVSGATFCRRHQISYQSFAKWRSQLRVNQVSTSFIDITPTYETTSHATSADWAIELTVGQHIVLRIRQPQ